LYKEDKVRLATTLAGISLEHPLMNAGGTCKTFEHAKHFVRSSVSAIVVGPVTPQQRDGNSGNVYWQGENFALNSLGMPNPGKEKFFSYHWPLIEEAARHADKPVILQIAGFSPEDYVKLAREAQEHGVKHIELNFGCPNIWDGGKQKGIVSFDPDAIVLIVNLVLQVFKGTIGLKLSPYSDPELLERVAAAINTLGYEVGYVACSNTFPNALALDPKTGKPVISVGGGLAGLSGKAMMPIALGQVLQFAPRLDYAHVVGVGGITNGQDILDFLAAGAVAVQASTPFWNAGEDPGVYSTILADYVDRFERKE
jgi:dihydroorotate dehydrogenase (fumarate)